MVTKRPLLFLTKPLLGLLLSLLLLSACAQSAYRANYGSMAPALAAKLQRAEADELIPVVVWLSGMELSGLESDLAAARAQRLGPGGKVESDNLALLRQIRTERSTLLTRRHAALA